MARRWPDLLWTAVVIAAAFLLSALILWAFGYPPLASLWQLVRGSVMGWDALAQTLIRSTPLLLTGLAVALAFRCGAFNIGAEGQYILGALGAGWVVVSIQGARPTWFYGQAVVLPLALLASALAGGAWGGLAGVLRVKRNVPEVISTIMLNFVAIALATYALRGPLQESARHYAQSDAFAREVCLVVLSRVTGFHAGFFLALAAAVAVFVLVQRTTLGFRLRATGHNPRAALHAGMRPGAAFATSMCVSGALAGLAGAVQVLGVDYRLFEPLHAGYGYTAIAVALLARLNALAVIASALFFGALAAGSVEMQREAQTPYALVNVVQGLIILLAVAGGVVRPSFAGRGRRDQPAPGEAA